MASSTPANAIIARLAANWSTTPIHLDGASDDQLPAEPAAFVALEFPGGGAEQITIGAPGDNLWREVGAFMVHVLVPASTTAAATARTYADSIAAIFRGQTFGGVLCHAPEPPHESSRASQGLYWNISFGVPYQFDLRA